MTATQAPVLRREQVRRLDALGHAASQRLRAASFCVVLSGWLLIAQAAAIAWAVQQVLVIHAPARSTLIALALLLACGLLRAALTWLSRHLADAAVETIRVDLRGQLIRRLLERGPLWLRQRRSGELAELMGTHAEAMEGYFGGYRLARDAADIRLLDLVEAMEGPLERTECSGEHSRCEHQTHCGLTTHWRRINDVIGDALRDVTLAQLLEPASNMTLPPRRIAAQLANV